MSFQNILVPTDGSEYTKAADAEAVDLASTVGGRITALFVKGGKNADTDPKAATSYVAGLCRERGIECTEVTIEGAPADVIIKESPKYDVIVMGTLGRTGMKKILVGSVAETVVKSAVCPVIVVKKSERIG